MALENTDPHDCIPTVETGRPLDEAEAAVILLHGRRRTALSMLSWSGALAHPGFAFLAPEAADRSWYPHGFMAPIEENEPARTSALAALDRLVARVAAAGLPPERLVFVGFSQGACLAAEFLATRPRRFGAAALIIGGVFGPEGRIRDYRGSLDGTPIFLGTSDPDSWVPPGRVRTTGRIFESMEAEVEVRVYPKEGHVINSDQVAKTRRLMDRVVTRGFTRPAAAASENGRRRRPHPSVQAADRRLPTRPSAS